MFCSRLSALISVLCDIFTVELAAADALPLTTAGDDFTVTGTTDDEALPDFCDDSGSVFPSEVGRAAEKAPLLPQPADGELFVSVPDGLADVGRLFPAD